jgi:hypothetical protein
MSINYGIPGTRVTAYTYEADYHCTDDARKAWGSDSHGWVPEDATDSEGNPIHPVFSMDSESEFEACSDCGNVICLTCGELTEMGEWIPQLGAAFNKCWNCGTTPQEGE